MRVQWGYSGGTVGGTFRDNVTSLSGQSGFYTVH